MKSSVKFTSGGVHTSLRRGNEMMLWTKSLPRTASTVSERFAVTRAVLLATSWPAWMVVKRDMERVLNQAGKQRE